jgi:hypothetical protein
MNHQTARYVVIYHPQFMNQLERQTWTHLIATEKAEAWRQHSSRLGESREEIPDSYSRSMSTDPEVLGLAEDGWEAYLERAATRILRDRGSEIYLNRCPQYGEVTATPRSKQCRYCRHDWHN